jgi:excisionase family DNA binding protein
LLTAAEIASLLGVPKSWVYEQSRKGKIPTVTLGRYRRYPRGHLGLDRDAGGQRPADVSRRSHGTGRLYARADANGRESWYGRWRAGERRRNQRLGPKRSPGERDGLTRAQAERELQRRIEADRPDPRASTISVKEARERLIAHLESLGRKRSTVGDYRSFLRVQLAPFFGDAPLSEIDASEVERFIVAKRSEGKAIKRPPAFRCGRSRSGWATATSRPP